MSELVGLEGCTPQCISAIEYLISVPTPSNEQRPTRLRGLIPAEPPGSPFFISVHLPALSSTKLQIIYLIVYRYGDY